MPPWHDPLVVWLLRAALALLFASTARQKLADRDGFRGVLAAYRVLPAALVGPAALAVAVGEGALAVAWLAPGGTTAATLATVALLGLYAAAIAVNLRRGRTEIDCGCGGPGVRQPIGWWLVVRNLVLAALALATLVPPAPRALHWIDWLTLAAGLAVLACAWTAAHGLAAAAARARGHWAAAAGAAS